MSSRGRCGLRDESGAIAAEHVAGTILIAAVIAALFAINLPQTLAAQGRLAACSLFGGECELELTIDDEGGSAAAAPDGGETPAPSQSGGPGADDVTFPDEIDLDPDGGFGGDGGFDVGPGGSTGGRGGWSASYSDSEQFSEHLEVSATVTGSRSRTNLEQDGCERTTLSVDATAEVKASANTNVRHHLNLGLEGFVGETAGMHVTVTDGHAQRIMADVTAAPNPFRPLDMPVGSSVELTHETFRGYGLNATYMRLLRGSEQRRTGEEVSLGVLRLPGDQIRLMVGEADLVAMSLAAGVGTSDVHLMAGVSGQLREGTLQTVDIDVRSPAGYETYAQLLRTGSFPTVDDAGVHDRAQVSYVRNSGEHFIRAKFEGLELEYEGNSVDYLHEETIHADGRVSASESLRFEDVTMLWEGTYANDASTEPLDESYGILLQGVHPQYYGLLEEMNGQSRTDLDEDQNVRIDFTGDELLFLRDQARTALEALSPRTDNLYERMAAADDPIDVLNAMLRIGTPETVIDRALFGPLDEARRANGEQASPWSAPGQFQRFAPC